jgi:hypothetical protein
MAKAETATTRAPRGARPVTQAFFTALELIPELARTAVAKAAQAMIREELKMRREKIRAATAKMKARTHAAAKPAAKRTSSKMKPASATKAMPAKRRTRRQPNVPVAA